MRKLASIYKALLPAARKLEERIARLLARDVELKQAVTAAISELTPQVRAELEALAGKRGATLEKLVEEVARKIRAALPEGASVAVASDAFKRLLERSGFARYKNPQEVFDRITGLFAEGRMTKELAEAISLAIHNDPALRLAATHPINQAVYFRVLEEAGFPIVNLARDSGYINWMLRNWGSMAGYLPINKGTLPLPTDLEGWFDPKFVENQNRQFQLLHDLFALSTLLQIWRNNMLGRLPNPELAGQISSAQREIFDYAVEQAIQKRSLLHRILARLPILRNKYRPKLEEIEPPIRGLEPPITRPMTDFPYEFEVAGKKYTTMPVLITDVGTGTIPETITIASQAGARKHRLPIGWVGHDAITQSALNDPRLTMIERPRSYEGALYKAMRTEPFKVQRVEAEPGKVPRGSYVKDPEHPETALGNIRTYLEPQIFEGTAREAGEMAGWGWRGLEPPTSTRFADIMGLHTPEDWMWFNEFLNWMRRDLGLRSNSLSEAANIARNVLGWGQLAGQYPRELLNPLAMYVSPFGSTSVGNSILMATGRSPNVAIPWFEPP